MKVNWFVRNLSVAAIITGVCIHTVSAAVSFGAFGYKAAQEIEQEPELTGDSGEEQQPVKTRPEITTLPENPNRRIVSSARVVTTKQDDVPLVAPLVPLTGDPVAPESEIIRQRSILNNMPKSRPVNTSAPVVAGQTGMPGGMTLQDAVVKSLDWDAGLSGLVNQYRAQLEAVYQKETEYYPQPGAGISRSLNNSDKGYVATASVSQLLYSFGKVSSQIDSLVARSDQSMLRVFVTADEVAEKTAMLYLDIKRYQEYIVLAEEQLSSVRHITDLARERTAAGAASRADLVQAEARQDSAQLQLNTLKLEHENQILNLNRMTGVSVSLLSEQPVDSSLYSRQCYAQNIDFNSVPVVLVARAGLTIAQSDREVAKREVMPSIGLQGTYQQRFDAKDTDRYGREDHSVELTVNVPLSNFYTSNSKQRMAAYQENAANSEIRHTQNIVENNWRNQQIRLNELEERMKLLDSRNLSLKDVTRLYQEQYVALGQRSIIDLLNADQEWHQSRRDYVAAKYDYLATSISCSSQLGLFRESLQLSNESLRSLQ
ncbi:TolC family protein [Morganella psychrotolerans]|uniref:TolC family outer membrane protein n=1 Tax=Morganella psychrotolerans TaxID=368603 RepID=A0A1B8HN76_9GAMM|nr:TolC family protein [Morganella psychrotolerans]OBU10750.1 hypothetical protein AYY17_14590 [Morganella psychrotolerans]